VRFGDHCYQTAMSTDSDIQSNADACVAKGADLWYPESSLEMNFVAAKFPSTSKVYHLGIDQISKTDGRIVYADYSMGTGVPFFSGNINCFKNIVICFKFRFHVGNKRKFFVIFSSPIVSP